MVRENITFQTVKRRNIVAGGVWFSPPNAIFQRPAAAQLGHTRFCGLRSAPSGRSASSKTHRSTFFVFKHFK